jgi:rod shape determining protein RodA
MMSKGQDFVRRLPDSGHHFKSATSIWRLIHIDPLLLLALLFISAYGLVVLYSASGHDQFMVKRQLVFFALGYMAMFAAAQVNLMFIERFSFWFYLLGIALLVLVLIIGVGAKGAQRWLSLGFVRFQPSEIVKLAVPITVAAFFSARILPPRFVHVVIALGLILLPAALIVKQPDLGTAILVTACGLIGLFLAGLPWRYIIGAVAAIAAAIWPMWHFVMHDYQKRRVLTLLDPEADKLGAGWNIIQSKTAIGSGGWEGKGWMKGTQSQLDFLPESHTDFIIAVLAEEFGLLGVLVLMAGYFFLISRGLWIATTAQSTFSRILAGSISLTFMVYIFVNIGMVSGLLPIVGVPLPLVSLGGTSLISLLFGFGLLMAIATERKRVTV